MDSGFTEHNNEQRRQLIDTIQVFSTFRAAEKELVKSYRSTLIWKTSKGHQYLYRNTHRHNRETSKSLGVKSKETERIFEEFTSAKLKLKSRLDTTLAVSRKWLE